MYVKEPLKLLDQLKYQKKEKKNIKNIKSVYIHLDNLPNVYIYSNTYELNFLAISQTNF